MRCIFNIVGLVFAISTLAGCNQTETAEDQQGRQSQSGQPGGHIGGSLNPNGLPKIAACKKIKLDDPVAIAKANIAIEDRRPFTVFGFTSADVPGVFCPNGTYRMESRGGLFVSDMPDACGGHSFGNAPTDAMIAYNRTLATDPKFQEITSCRPSTYCEENYQKGYISATERDPKCPAQPKILLNVAQKSDPVKLTEALQDFLDGTPRSRDAVTSAFIGAIGSAQWDNTEILLRAGADINGKAYDTYPDGRAWLGSPLTQIFNQNIDTKVQISRAQWLFSKGGDFTNPGANRSLSIAAFSNDTRAVNYLLAKGAQTSGGYPKEELDRLAKGHIGSAGGGFGYARTPFYAAIGNAEKDWVERTPEQIAHAKAEHRKGRINAVTLYRAGGRFLVGTYYDELRRKPDIKLASIILAAAHREGRLDDLIERLLYPNGRKRAILPPDASPELRKLIEYLKAVQSCPKISLKPKVDYVKLCAIGKV